jgi:hypothetical protein
MWIKGKMHSVVRQVEKEGFIFMLPNVTDGPLGVTASHRVLLGYFDSLHDLGATDHWQGRLVIALES